MHDLCLQKCRSTQSRQHYPLLCFKCCLSHEQVIMTVLYYVFWSSRNCVIVPVSISLEQTICVCSILDQQTMGYYFCINIQQTMCYGSVSISLDLAICVCSIWSSRQCVIVPVSISLELTICVCSIWSSRQCFIVSVSISLELTICVCSIVVQQTLCYCFHINFTETNYVYALCLLII